MFGFGWRKRKRTRPEKAHQFCYVCWHQRRGQPLVALLQPLVALMQPLVELRQPLVTLVRSRSNERLVTTAAMATAMAAPTPVRAPPAMEVRVPLMQATRWAAATRTAAKGVEKKRMHATR